ncbi:MAG: acyl-CoA thioesterase [Anaerolineae bacterium]|nr:acyl-CoA thioesterase [Anaerolineae bacterium]
MGIVHHASYLLYFEIGRVELIRQTGASYTDPEASGYSLAVGDIRIRYIASAHFDQQLTVRTQAANTRSRSVTFVYEIVDATTGQILVTGNSKLIYVDHNGTVSHIPERWIEAIRPFDTSE